MGAEIDRLELQVEAQATKANNQLDKLVGKLDAVTNSLSHINANGLSGLASGVQKFAQASSQLSSVKTADFTRLTKNIDKLSSLNTQQIFSASLAITTLSKAVDGLGSVSSGSAQAAAAAVSSASNDSAGTAIPKSPKTGDGSDQTLILYLILVALFGGVTLERLGRSRREQE